MAIQIPSGTSQYDILSSGTTYILGATKTINVSGENGIFASDAIDDDLIVIKGTINQTGSGFAGIRTDGEDMSILIAAGGKIDAVTGIYSENFEPSNRLHIKNEGLLEGSLYAIQTFDSREVVVNHGTMRGRIDLGSGKDLLDNRGGIVDHKIEGGTGDDTLITDKASTKLKEDGGSAGYDTVISFVSYTLSENVERLILRGNNNLNGTGTLDGDDLFGNAGRNRLSGLDGVDRLEGGRGNDLLIGGDNADTFVFKTGFDHDTIQDFENGIDHVNLKQWNAIANFNDLKNNHLTVDGNDLVIRAGSDELVLLDTKKSELDSGDFSF